MSKIYGVLLILMVLISSTAHAEGGCPPGQVPQQGNGWRACVPASSNASTDSGSQFHGPEIEARWISIAVDRQKGVMALSTEGSRTQAEAQASAERSCVTKGGLTCTAFVTAKNGCVAMVGSDTQIFGESAPIKADSEHQAMDSCAKASAQNCYVIASSCVSPVYK
jgi:hypothetical protein